jgi:16S rRNA (uracil1498-N3)-methyltransferase
MTRRRWIADEVSDGRAALVGAHADHLGRVLRAQVGQEFDVVANGTAHRARIVQVGTDRVDFELGEAISHAAIPNITLAISIFKFDRMEWAIEKCTELGVARIVPVIAQRTEKHLSAAAGKRVERWQRIARQAAEQSRRTSPPEIAQPIRLKDGLALPGNQRVVLSEAERGVMLRDVLQPGGDLVLAFGPEGGWTETELESFVQARWTPASLGPTILRAETAVIAATAITLSSVG